MALTVILAPIIASLAPRGEAPLAIAASVLVVIAFRAHCGRWPRVDLPSLGLVLALVAWGALSAFWSPKPRTALGQAGELAYLLVPALLYLAVATQGPRLTPRHMALILAAFFLGLALAAIDQFGGQRVYMLVRGHWGTFQGDEGNVLTNRSLAALSALAWPAAAIVWIRGHRLLSLLLPIALGAVLLGGESQSAALGTLVGVLVLGVATAMREVTRWVLAVATTAYALLVVPIKLWLADAMAGIDLPSSFLHRLGIWQFASGLAAERPLAGWGLDSSRVLGDGHFVLVRGEPHGALPLHPHDAFLQAWLELGGIGAAILLVLLLRALWATRSLPIAAQPVALAAYATTVAMTTVAYGAWQGWWLGVLILTAAAITAVARAGSPEPRR
jgi:O-antigen ligase